jgi:hypothetical protein
VLGSKKKSKKAATFDTPMAAQPVTELPEVHDWIYEIKWDGYRALLLKDGERVQIRSRNDKDLTRMYPTIAAAALKLNANTAGQPTPFGIGESNTFPAQALLQDPVFFLQVLDHVKLTAVGPHRQEQ